MAYSKEIVDNVLNAIALDKNAKEISEKFGVSLSTISRWKNKYSLEIAKLKIYIEASKHIKDLISQNKLDEALTIANSQAFKYDFIIQSQKIGILIKKNKLKAAWNLARAKRFKDYFPIQSQKITILIKQDNLDEAFRLASEERFKDHFHIQSQLITILMRQNKLNKAFALASEERFKDYFPIQSQLITILIELNRLNKAWNLANEERFDEYSYILGQRQQIRQLMFKSENEIFQIEMDVCIHNNSHDNSKKIIELIYKKEINSEDEILESNIAEWQKIVLLVAFYEINSYPFKIVINYLKRQQVIYANNSDILRIIQKLLARAKSKNRIFDLDFYRELLSLKIRVSTDIDGERAHLLNIQENIQDLSEEDKPKR